tara:strand:+ start:29 stop:1306 length:1278 start_codon:yes stop_codon:yes gene_type:complete
MNPSSQIKNVLKQKLKYENPVQDNISHESILVSDKPDILSIKQEPTPKTLSMLSFLTNSTRTPKMDISTNNNYYYYPIDFLDKNIDSLNSNDIDTVNLCIYTVNTQATQPFILYLLNKYNDEIFWPNFSPQSDILVESNTRIDTLGLSDETELQGFIKENNQIYLFYKTTDNFEYSYNYEYSTTFWWVSMYEILFSRKLLYFTVDNSVYNLFIKEPRLQYLLNKENLYYQVPIVAFNGSHANGIDYQIKIGLMKGRINRASQGPYYYFANYMRAAKFGAYNVVGGYKEYEIGGDIITDNEFGRYKRGGIIRFIVFPGKEKVVFNREWDKPNPQIESDRNLEFSKKKIYDTTGLWTEQYNSVLVGPIEISKNQLLHNGTSLTVQNFFQYKPLSYHYLDKNTVPEQYSPEIDERFWEPESSPYFRII